jgi:hypothetical protein
LLAGWLAAEQASRGTAQAGKTDLADNLLPQQFAASLSVWNWRIAADQHFSAGCPVGDGADPRRFRIVVAGRNRTLIQAQFECSIDSREPRLG